MHALKVFYTVYLLYVSILHINTMIKHNKSCIVTIRTLCIITTRLNDLILIHSVNKESRHSYIALSLYVSDTTRRRSRNHEGAVVSKVEANKCRTWPPLDVSIYDD